MSSDSSVARISRRGVVRVAARPGTAIIRVIAHNGREKKIPLRVVNYAYPTSLDTSRGARGIIKDYWDTNGSLLSAFVTEVLQRDISVPGPDYGVVKLDNKGDLTSTVTLPAPVADLATQILTNFWLPGQIRIFECGVMFKLDNPEDSWTYEVIYGCNWSARSDPGDGNIAPHWYAYARQTLWARQPRE